MTGRYVLLGLAPPRAAWFRDVAQWANTGAVLVMAFLGAAMWVAFNGTMHSAQSKVDNNVNSIGTGGSGAP